MSKYSRDFTKEFEKDLKKIRFDFELQKRLKNKIEEVLKNPHHYKPLRHVLKGMRRIHIGSFVLIFEIIENEKAVAFHRFKHHDEAYK
ncbi:MAG: type II toxin-antitoxin system mRNA interferase toxin, RelE/StbE family [Pseudomonadota bacterium]|nr:type II toxin-antitoxin system RelE/ParE family toxin [Pseudomonadota bacterium]